VPPSGPAAAWAARLCRCCPPQPPLRQAAQPPPRRAGARRTRASGGRCRRSPGASAGRRRWPGSPARPPRLPEPARRPRRAAPPRPGPHARPASQPAGPHRSERAARPLRPPRPRSRTPLHPQARRPLAHQGSWCLQARFRGRLRLQAGAPCCRGQPRRSQPRGRRLQRRAAPDSRRWSAQHAAAGAPTPGCAPRRCAARAAPGRCRARHPRAARARPQPRPRPGAQGRPVSADATNAPHASTLSREHVWARARSARSQIQAPTWWPADGLTARQTMAACACERSRTGRLSAASRRQVRRRPCLSPSRAVASHLHTRLAVAAAQSSPTGEDGTARRARLSTARADGSAGRFFAARRHLRAPQSQTRAQQSAAAETRRSAAPCSSAAPGAKATAVTLHAGSRVVTQWQKHGKCGTRAHAPVSVCGEHGHAGTRRGLDEHDSVARRKRTHAAVGCPVRDVRAIPEQTGCQGWLSALSNKHRVRQSPWLTAAARMTHQFGDDGSTTVA